MAARLLPLPARLPKGWAGLSTRRLSRFAIAGAVWALFGLPAVIPTLFFIALNRVWNGTALLTDLVHEQPPLPFLIFMVLLLAVGSGAPIGTTICGALAIGHIKRSGGKIVGLPLAVADAIFFPLLALGSLIAFLTALIWAGIAPHPNVAALYSAASRESPGSLRRTRSPVVSPLSALLPSSNPQDDGH